MAKQLRAKTGETPPESRPNDIRSYADVRLAPLDQPPFYETLAATRKGRESVLKVLEATRSVLETDGYAQLTLRSVAERAGIAHASLQHHFPTKEKLLHGFMRHAIGIYREDIRNIYVTYEGDPVRKLRAYVRYYIDDIQRPNAQTIFYEIRAMAQHSGFIDSALESSYLHYQKRVDVILGEINPKLDPDTRATRAALIISLIDGLVPFFRGDIRKPAERKRVAQAAEEQIMLIATSPAP
jgi:AcrR family transcriptional regulator